MRQTPLTLFITLAVTLALIAPMAVSPAVAGGGEDTVELDPSIPINSDAKLETFEETGVASAPVNAPQMRITISDSREGVGEKFSLNPLKSSTRNDFIRIEHQEDIKRTVQIPIREGYWKPFPRDGLKSLDESHTATLDSVQMDGERFTILTVTFTGAEQAVFPVPADAVAVYSAAENTENRTNSTFGIGIGLTPSPWESVQSEVFTANDTAVRIEGNPEKMLIQYNTGTPQDPEWVPVPKSERRAVPVYRMKKQGVSDAVYVVSTSTNAPELRYKTEATFGDKLGGWVNGARSLPSRIEDGLGVDIPILTTGLGGVTV